MTNQLLTEAAAEIWRSIPGWPDYEASSAGRIRLAVDRPNSRWGHGLSEYRRGTIIAQRVRHRREGDVPYCTIKLRANGKQNEKRVNRLVCLAFHGLPPTAKHHAAHNDGNSLNNVPTNLRWATPFENVADTAAAGKTSAGERHTPSKLKIFQIREIRARKQAGQLNRVIASAFGISPSTVGQIVRGETWRTVM